jgi:hypothetical protein
MTRVLRYLHILVKFTSIEYIIEDKAGKTNIGSTLIALLCQSRTSDFVVMIA